MAANRRKANEGFVGQSRAHLEGVAYVFVDAVAGVEHRRYAPLGVSRIRGRASVLRDDRDLAGPRDT